MTLEFQKDLLRVLAQSPAFRKYVALISEDIFELPETQVVFQLLQSYIKKYKKQPSYSSLLELWDRVSKKQTVEASIYKNVQVEIGSVYETYEGDLGLLQETIVEQVQYRMAKILVQKYAGQLNDGLS